MSDKPKEVVQPRVAMDSLPQEKFDKYAETSDLMNTDLKSFGKSAHLMGVIDESYKCPGFVEDSNGQRLDVAVDHSRVPPEPRTVEEAMARDPLMKRHDCTHGCGNKQTVQPVNSSGKDWQCSACGKNYELS